jgi:hypothetical protein
MSMIRFNDKPVEHGVKKWTISGWVHMGGVYLDRIEGDITDIDGLRAAIAQMLTRPRYQRALAG